MYIYTRVYVYEWCNPDYAASESILLFYLYYNPSKAASR